MFYMMGLPDGMLALDAIQSDDEYESVGPGSRWKSRRRDMDDDFDGENSGFEEDCLDDLREDEFSDEPDSFEQSGEEV